MVTGTLLGSSVRNCFDELGITHWQWTKKLYMAKLQIMNNKHGEMTVKFMGFKKKVFSTKVEKEYWKLVTTSLYWTLNLFIETLESTHSDS